MKIYHDFVFFVHDTKVLIKASVFVLVVLLIMQLLICLGLINIFLLDRYEWMVILKFIGAKIISNINPEYPILFTNPDGTTIRTTAQIICNNESIKQMTNWVLSEATVYLFRSSVIYILYPISLFFLVIFKPPQKKKLHIRGSKLMSKKEFYTIAKKRKDKLDLPFGEIRMPISCEEKSCLSTGKPGVGKTSQLSEIFSHLRKKDVRMIIYDLKGDYVERFYDPKKDIIFNPFDIRGVDWNVFQEIFNPLDIDAVASSLIPSLDGTNADPFWSDGARDVVSSVLNYLQYHNFNRNSDIWKMVSSDGKTIAGNLKKTPGCEKGYKYVVEHRSKQAASILAVVMQYTSCFEYMKDGDSVFSINDWIESGTGNIFISNNASVQSSLKPILSLFIDLLSRKILSMPDNSMGKTVFLLDEFTSLQKLPSLINLLTLGRSKEVSCYLGTQSFGQIEGLYGKAYKESIINACGNQVIFSVAGSETAKEASAILGEAESVRLEKSLSTGSDYREGAALAFRNTTDPILLPSEIMGLNDLECIVKFANYSPVKSQLEYTVYPKKHDGFIMRSALTFKNKN
jgi:hypothetical protein